MGSNNSNAHTGHPTVVRIEIGELCLESDPCQHYCIMWHRDGTVERELLYGSYIYHNFKHLMTSSDLKHFKTYKQKDKVSKE